MQLLAMSLLAGMAGAVLSITFNSGMTETSSACKDDTNDVDSGTSPKEVCPLPFESLGFCYDDLPPLLSFITPWLRHIEPALIRAARGISESLIASVVCLPICIFYIVRIQISRSHHVSSF